MSLREQEGYIPVGDYRVWYRIVGGGAEHEQIPLLTVHGGPGIPHDYVIDMAELASDSRPPRAWTRQSPPVGPVLWRFIFT